MSTFQAWVAVCVSLVSAGTAEAAFPSFESLRGIYRITWKNPRAKRYSKTTLGFVREYGQVELDGKTYDRHVIGLTGGANALEEARRVMSHAENIKPHASAVALVDPSRPDQGYLCAFDVIYMARISTGDLAFYCGRLKPGSSTQDSPHARLEARNGETILLVQKDTAPLGGFIPIPVPVTEKYLLELLER